MSKFAGAFIGTFVGASASLLTIGALGLYMEYKLGCEPGSVFGTRPFKSSAIKNEPSHAVRSKFEEPTIVKKE